MSEPFDVTNDLIPVVEEEQDISSDFWYTDDESDTNSVIAQVTYPTCQNMMQMM